MAKRRSRQSHTGSVYQSGGVWFAAVMVDGRRRRARAASKAEALARLAELRKVAEQNAGLRPSTFGAFRAEWIEHLRGSKATTTITAYQYALDKLAELDQIPLERLTPQLIQKVIDTLSGRTRQQVFDKVKQLLKVAVKWKSIGSNPMDLLERPAHEREQIDPFELTEVAAILEHLADHRYGPAVRLALSCGLRGGKMWGLQWSDLHEGKLTIQRQACESGGKIEIKSPKTKSGFRKIDLPDSVCEALANRKRDAMKEGNAKSPWIFPGRDGATTRRSNFGNRVWIPALKELKIRPRGFHHARHTAATLLLNSGGVPLPVVAKMLGHKSPKITLEIYAHVMTADVARHRNAFDNVLRVG